MHKKENNIKQEDSIYLQVQLNSGNIKILVHHSHPASFQYCTCMRKKHF